MPEPRDAQDQPIAPNAAVLVTGSKGLIGTHLVAGLDARGIRVRELDVRAVAPRERGDVRDPAAILRAAAGCRGIVHLAAVSRVERAQRDPELCRATNVDGTRNVLDAARALSPRPWVLFASSREVYGQQATIPVDETAELRPLNAYARSKVDGEAMCVAARASGVRTAIVRLSNVYGSTADHADRVVPAFARAAALGGKLSVHGAQHAFDFVHVDDAIAGLCEIVERLDEGDAVPTLHLTTGVATSLHGLARLALESAGVDGEIVFDPPRDYDVSSFCGDPARARTALGWTAKTSLADGLARLVEDFRRDRNVGNRNG